jgi:hypothetical protein
MCPRGEVVVSGDDGTGSITRVPIVRYAWVPVVTFCPCLALDGIIIRGLWLSGPLPGA